MSDPEQILTTKGMLPLVGLTKKVQVHQRPRSDSTWTEYYLGEELVRRDIANRQLTNAELAERASKKETT